MTEKSKVSDRKVAPILRGSSVAHTEYVDNFGAFSLDPARAAEVVGAVDAELRHRGWPLRPIEVTAGGELLGWTFGEDTPTMRVTPARAWKLRLGIEGLLSRGACSGDEMRALIGSCTFAGLVRRESLSVFSAVYAFMDRYMHRRARLWTAVRRELRWFAAPPLCLCSAASWTPSGAVRST